MKSKRLAETLARRAPLNRHRSGLFWGDSNQLHWNRIALAAVAQRSTTLSDNARLFALLNLALADANIVAFDAKYYYNWWRPISAIRLADTDGNDYTDPDPTWTPLQTTPNHQEYVSGHSTLSGAAARVLAAIFGDNVTITHGSDTLPGVTRTHTSFSAIADEANESRIFTGAHFRSSCNDGKAAGDALGNFVVTGFARPN
jgi:membrane-associated phospholipid phosphatase